VLAVGVERRVRQKTVEPAASAMAVREANRTEFLSSVNQDLEEGCPSLCIPSQRRTVEAERAGGSGKRMNRLIRYS
jgi:hypothetical protein